MSEENINEESTVVEKNIPVFIETDGVTVQVGWASEVSESGGRAIEKFSAFKKVVLVNPIFGDGEGEIHAPIETHVEPEQDGLTEPGIKGLLQDHGVEVGEVTVDGHPIDSNAPTTPAPEGEEVEEDEEAEFQRQLAEEQARENSKPVEGGTDESLNAAPVSADPDGDTAVGKAAPAPIKGSTPDPFTRTN